MKRQIFSFLLLLITGALCGQSQGYFPSDFWIKYTNTLSFDLKLEPLSLKATNFHYRFWCKGQVIDIWKNGSDSYGEIVNYAKQYDEMNLGKRTFYSSEVPVETGIVSEICQLIHETDLNNISTSDAIDGWEKRADGFTYIFESVDSGGYSFKCYLSPDEQVSVTEAITIQSFLDKLDKLLKLKKRYKSFSGSIPFWCYTRGTVEVICRKK